MRVLVIGGTLFIGKGLVKRLIGAGHEVSVLHRRPDHPFGKKVQNLVADRNDATTVRAALTGKRFDAVYDIAYDWQRGTTAQQVEACAKAIPGDLQRYIFMSSVAAYGDGLGHAEEDTLASDLHDDPYVANKAASERALFRMYHESRFPVVTMRPPFVYGPENPFYREAFFWDRLRARRKIILPGDGNRLMQFVHVNDLVETCFRALEKPTAVGRAFNVADEKPLTQLEVIHALAKAAGREAEIVKVPRRIIALAGGNPYVEPYYFGQYYDLPPITMTASRIRRVLGVIPTPFAEGLKETFKAYSKQARPKRISYKFEDELMTAAAEARLIPRPIMAA